MLNPSVLLPENAAQYNDFDVMFRDYTGGVELSALRIWERPTDAPNLSYISPGELSQYGLGGNPGQLEGGGGYIDRRYLTAHADVQRAWNATHQHLAGMNTFGKVVSFGIKAGAAVLTGVAISEAAGAGIAGSSGSAFSAPTVPAATSPGALEVLTGVGAKVIGAVGTAVETAATSAVVSKLVPKPDKAELTGGLPASALTPPPAAYQAPAPSLFDSMVDFLWKLLSPATSA